MATLSAANSKEIQAVIDYIVKSNAPQLPFDATAIERLARVAASVGFEGAGNFKEDAKNSPITTLLALAKFLGT